MRHAGGAHSRGEAVDVLRDALAQEPRPCIHDRTALIEQVVALVGRLRLTGDLVGQRELEQIAAMPVRCARALFRSSLAGAKGGSSRG